FDLKELIPYIDWQPYFIAWEMHGKFPQILEDPTIGQEATKLYNDANALLHKIIEEKWLKADGVIGFWKANSNGKDTVTLIREENGTKEDIALQFLRQQAKKAGGQPNMSLADYIAPAEEALVDHIGAFAV